MFVSSPPSSDSVGALRFGVRAFDDATLPVGDVLPVSVGVAVRALLAPGRGGGGRIVDGFLETPVGRGGIGAAIADVSLTA